MAAFISAPLRANSSAMTAIQDLVQRLRLPARAVLALHDLADTREGEVFRIEALTTRGRAFDKRDPGRRSKLLVAIEGNLPGRLANRNHEAVHHITEDENAIAARADAVAGMTGRVPLELNRLDDTGQEIRARLEGQYLRLDRTHQGRDLVDAEVLCLILLKATQPIPFRRGYMNRRIGESKSAGRRDQSADVIAVGMRNKDIGHAGRLLTRRHHGLW